MRLKRYMMFSLALMALFACGGDDETPIVPDAGSMMIDAMTDEGVEIPDQESDLQDTNSSTCEVDAAMGAVVSTEQLSCDQLCARFNCACTTGEHIAFGQIEGEARYSGRNSNILRCESVPPPNTQGIDGTVEEFLEVECFCE